LAEVVLTLFIEGKRMLEKRGDLLFIPHGISGTAIFALSRAASEALQQGKKVAIQINLVPGLSTEELTTFLHEKKKNFPQQLLSLLLQGILPERLSQFILTSLHLDLNLTIGLLSEDKIDSLIQNLINFYLPITCTQSWKYAQVTGGGVTVEEVNPETMGSKIVPHLYFAGEILDVDGDCGGYNLQWAWSSGYLAGKSAVENN
jgi:predicted Rossmann fold flavoprotein